VSDLDIPTSLNGPILFSRASKRRVILWETSMNCSCSLTNISYARSQVLLVNTLIFHGQGFAAFFLILFLDLTNSPKHSKQTTLIPIWSVNSHGYSIGTICHNRSYTTMKSYIMQFISLDTRLVVATLLLIFMKITKYKNEISGKYTHHPHKLTKYIS